MSPRLNESPYEKVGKSNGSVVTGWEYPRLNESPYEKVGKCGGRSRDRTLGAGLNESPYEKVGKFGWLIESNAHFVKPQ